MKCTPSITPQFHASLPLVTMFAFWFGFVVIWGFVLGVCVSVSVWKSIQLIPSGCCLSFMQGRYKSQAVFFSQTKNISTTSPKHQTEGNKYLFESWLLILLSIFPEGKGLLYMIIHVINFLRNHHGVFLAAAVCYNVQFRANKIRKVKFCFLKQRWFKKKKKRKTEMVLLLSEHKSIMYLL